MNVLVINTGSSSLKYQLFDMVNKTVMAKGLCERIGLDGKITHTPSNGKPEYKADADFPTHTEAAKMAIDLLTSPEYGVIASMADIKAVGHRVVHGGEYFSRSVIIDDEVLARIEECTPFAPLHNPCALIGIQACAAIMPNIPQVGVFDTAFHQTMPKKAFLFALPYRYYDENKIRKYGFHGSSHRYVSRRAAEMLGRPIEELRIITCHLGNGSSIAAIKGGRVCDTSMGFTPLDGLPMGTRSGGIDPAVIGYIAELDNLSAQQVIDILNKESGVLGISGLSSDFRDLQKAAAEGNERAALAIDIFLYGVQKYIGTYAAVMGGVDAVVFTAGIGENNSMFRERICTDLGFLGIEIDLEKNNQRGMDLDVSAAGAKVRVMVIPTNEELVIAEDTMQLVSK